MQHDDHVAEWQRHLEEMRQIWRTMQAIAMRKRAQGESNIVAFLPNELNDMI